MKKCIIAFVLFALLVFTLWGCGAPAVELLSVPAVELLTIKEASRPDNQMKIATAYMKGELDSLKNIKKVAIAEFTVGYLYYSDYTGFGTQSTSRFKFSDEAYQYASEKLYNDFITILKNNGIAVVNDSVIKANENFQKLVGKPAEEIQGYNPVNNKVIKYRLIPAPGFKATGGGTGLDIAGNSLAQISNKGLYPNISKDWDADATITVHLIAGYDSTGRLNLGPNNVKNLELFRIYYGVDEAEPNNVVAKKEFIVNLDSAFSLKDVGNIKGELSIDQLTDAYSTLLKVLFESTMKKATM